MDIMGHLGPNPWSTQQMQFAINAFHERNNIHREAIIGVTLPLAATEHQARRMIIEMALDFGWRMLSIKRINDSSMGDTIEE